MKMYLRQCCRRISKTNQLTVLTIVLVLLVVQNPLLASPQFDPEALARMQAGDVVVETLHKDQPGGAARVTATFFGDSDALWQVIGDCRFQMIYIKGISECEVLQPGSSTMVVRHRLRESWYTPTLDFSFTADRTKDGKGVAKLVAGNLKVFEGMWEVMPIKDTDMSIVNHEIRVQPKFLAPRWLIRRALKKDLPDMLACIRGLAAASADQQAQSVDLQRCPGDANEISRD